MKIVVIPGVGYQKSMKTYENFAKKIKSKFDCEYEIFTWHHSESINRDFNLNAIQQELNAKNELCYSLIRSFVVEVILDFEYAIKYGGSVNVPFADYYIGHSAGCLFALSNDKNCALMGNPVALVKYLPVSIERRNLFINRIIDSNVPVLNLINRYDVLSYPMEDKDHASKKVENIYFNGNKLNPLTYSPLNAHTGYWTSDFVVNEIVKNIKKTFNG